MGLRTTRWETSYEGRRVIVSRDELTRGIDVVVDDKVVGNKKWSWLGTGTIAATVEHAGRSVALEVKVSPPWKCKVSVDGQPLSVTKLR